MTAGRAAAQFARVTLLTCLAAGILGYHLGADDAAIYVPAVKKAADPGLYSFGAQFFMSHAHLTLLPALVGGSARLTRLPVDWAIFAWHLAGIFLLLEAAWLLVCACFENAWSRYGGLALLAVVLGMPATGTALALMDPYLTARSLSTPCALFAVACWLRNRTGSALLWLAATALVHPQMSAYCGLLLVSLEAARRHWLPTRLRLPLPAAAVPGVLGGPGLPFLYPLGPERGPAREALLARTYFFVSQWTWYEWLGVLAPLAILEWLAAAPLGGTRPAFRMLARALVPFGLLFTALAVPLGFVPWLENYARLQPMRAFHLLYVAFVLLLGGLLGEYVLRWRAWRWAVCFLPLAAGMFLLQRSTYPSSAHIEWPGHSGSSNSWTNAFLWIREHTPKGAVFALDPGYMALPGEDQHGFRAVAERSVLADRVKDSGAVSLFPQLAGEWKDEVDAQAGWDRFEAADFERLARRYPVNWILTRHPVPGLSACPYVNPQLAVCRIGDDDAAVRLAKHGTK